MSAFAKAERRAGGACPTEGDAAAIEALLDACVGDVATALSGSPPPPPPPCQKFPATGQTTCWDSTGNVISCAGTRQDGEIQAGATLSYTDNGNGTITDNNTGLVWEKKSDDGTIHDKDNFYTWDEAFDVHVFTLNNICANNETVDCSANGNADCAAARVGGKCGFAGKRDWRLPNYKELTSILNLENSNTAVSTAFNNNCMPGATVLTGSCTEPGASFYWSSTTFAFNPVIAWIVDFSSGFVFSATKDTFLPVRAVRGSSP
jgi:hypothetical protein